MDSVDVVVKEELQDEYDCNIDSTYKTFESRSFEENLNSSLPLKNEIKLEEQTFLSEQMIMVNEKNKVSLSLFYIFYSFLLQNLYNNEIKLAKC